MLTPLANTVDTSWEKALTGGLLAERSRMLVIVELIVPFAAVVGVAGNARATHPLTDFPCSAIRPQGRAARCSFLGSRSAW
jgi:hypothetical protein